MKNLIYKPLELNHLDPKNVFVWSDLHLGHDRDFIWGPRGFDCVEEHDQVLTRLWETTLNENSTIFILGDIMFGHNAHERLIQFFKRVPFHRCYLMPGNHHAGFKQLLDDAEPNLEWIHLDRGPQRHVQFLPNYVEARIDGLFYVMSHYPILSANRQGKHDFGGMLHGHCHGNLHRDDFAKEIYKRRVMDVGVECCPEPVSFQRVRTTLERTVNESFDHH